MSHKLLLGIVGGALALIVAVGAAFAAGPSLQNTITSTLSGATATPTDQSTLSQNQVSNASTTAGKANTGAARLLAVLLKATAQVSALPERQVISQLRGGSSMAQIAQNHGKSASDIIQAARTTVSTRLQQAVSSGKLTQQHADTQLARFDKAAPTMVNTPNLARQISQQAGRTLNGRAVLINATSQVTGLSTSHINQELQSGKSLAQIAQEHGKSGDDILNQLSQTMQQRVQQALQHARIAINTPGLGAAAQPTATP